MALSDKIKKISILDVMRKNLFWVGIVLFILGLGGAYFFLIRSLGTQLKGFRETADKSYEMISGWHAKPFIPNENCTKAAEKDTNKIQSYQSQMMLLYSLRPDPVTDRSLLEDITADPGDKLWIIQERDWWNAYLSEGEALLEELKTRFNASENVFTLEKKQTGRTKGQLQVIDNDFCVLRQVAEGLLAASPSETPYIKRVESIRIDKGGTATIKHEWVKAVCVNVVVGIDYANLPLLIQRLQALPRPIMVSGYNVSQFPPKEDEEAPGLRVVLRCELLKFRPFVSTINFSGARFGKNELLKTWIDTNSRQLAAASLTLVQKLPAYEQLLAEIEKKVQPEFEQVGPVPPVDREKLLKNLKRNIPYTVIHDHLNAMIPQKAYYAGEDPSKKILIFAKLPDDPKNDGRWVIADYAAGTSYPASHSLRAMVDYLEKTPVRQTRVDLGVYRGAKVVVFKDIEKGDPVQILISEEDGIWRVCPVVREGDKPLTLSDAAFRLPAIIQLMSNVPEKNYKVGKVMEFQKLAGKKARSQENTFNIKDNGQSGTIVIKSGFRD